MRTSLLAALTLVCASAALSAQSDGARAQLATGVRLYEERRYDDAEAWLAPLAAASPVPPEAAFYLGRIALRHSDPAAAVRWLERATSAEPRNAAYQHWLGRAYAQDALTGSRLRLPFVARRAKGALERAVALDPDDVEARADLMQYYLVAPGLLGGSDARAREQAREIARRSRLRGHIALAPIRWHD